MPPSTPDSHPKAFPKTRWSQVLDAQNNDPQALAALCQSYWYPLYGFARRRGYSVEDAEDLTQGFFEHFLDKEFLKNARRERGKLRTLMMRGFKNYSTDQWLRSRRQKRGGGQSPVAIAALAAEARLCVEPTDGVTPELEFDRCWAREILSVARSRVEGAYAEAGKLVEFHAFEHQLSESADDGKPYRDAAAELGLSEASARYVAFKLRQRYRDTLLEVVTETVSTPEEAAEELAYLQRVFGLQSR